MRCDWRKDRSAPWPCRVIDEETNEVLSLCAMADEETGEYEKYVTEVGQDGKTIFIIGDDGRVKTVTKKSKIRIEMLPRPCVESRRIFTTIKILV